FGTAVFNQVEAQEGEKAFGLGEVIVSATKTEHTLDDVPVAAEVITKEQIEKMNVKTVQDALRKVGGIRVRRNVGSWGDKGKVEIWGTCPKHALILVDGQRIHGGHGKAVDLQQIPVDVIERIEIVKGPASVLYGSDAIGGVINIITKPVPDKPTISVSPSFGNRGTRIFELNGGGKSGGIGALLNYTFRHSNGVDKKTDEFHEHFVDGKFQFDISESMKLSARPFYSIHEMEYEKRKQERWGINSAVKWSADKDTTVTLRGSFFNYKHWTSNKKSDWDNDNYELELLFSRLFFENHLFTAGYHFWKQDIDDRGKSYKADQTTHGLFLQDEIDLSPLMVTLGGRLDKHDEWGSRFNPKLSVLYKITEDLKIRGSAGKAFKAPTLVELYAGEWRMGRYIVRANPDLKPEKSVGTSLGVEYRFLEDYVFNLTFFRNDIKDVICRYTTPGPRGLRYLSWQNYAKARTQGLELNLSGEVSKNLNFILNYNLIDAKNRTRGKKLRLRPENTMSGEINYFIPPWGMNLNLSGNYTGKRYEDVKNTIKLGGYTTFDIAINKKLWKNADFFVRVDNITGKKNIFDEPDIDGAAYLAGIKIKF
ncbi:MAG TPA: TonB-dependent receptor, partial [Desulfurella acetivorans]|nr:TonB-dependent receptor [Desulfurella acetivorans]